MSRLSQRSSQSRTNSIGTPRSPQSARRVSSPRSNVTSPGSARFESPRENANEDNSPYGKILRKYEAALQDDVSVLVNQETSIYDLNDHNIALARVISNKMSSNAVLHEQINKERMEYIQNKIALDERKKKVATQQDDYDDAVGKLNEANRTKKELTKQIQNHQQTVQQIVEQTKQVFTQLKPEDPEKRKVLNGLQFEVNILRSEIESRKSRIQRLLDLNTQSKKDLRDLSIQKDQLAQAYKDLQAKYNQLKEIDKTFMDVLAEPYDPLPKSEKKYVERIEKEAEEWELKLDEFPLSDTQLETKIAIENLSNLQQENYERKQALHERQQNVISTNLKMTATSRAATSTTRYKTTVVSGNTRGTSAAYNQHRLALNMVKDIFLKITQKEQYIDNENKLIDEMIERHNKTKDPIMQEWNEKITKIEGLSKDLNEIDAIIIDISRVKNSIAELKREEAQHIYEIEKVHRINTNIQADKDKIEKKQKELKEVKERIDSKTKNIQELEKELQERREKLEKEKEEYEIKFNEFKEKERHTAEIQRKTTEKNDEYDKIFKERSEMMNQLGISNDDDSDTNQPQSETTQPPNVITPEEEEKRESNITDSEDQENTDSNQIENHEEEISESNIKDNFEEDINPIQHHEEEEEGFDYDSKHVDIHEEEETINNTEFDPNEKHEEEEINYSDSKDSDIHDEEIDNTENKPDEEHNEEETNDSDSNNGDIHEEEETIHNEETINETGSNHEDEAV